MSDSRLRQFIRKITPQGGTGERVVKSGIWLAGQNAFGRVIQLGMLLILARLIGPREIGVAGIVLLALSALKKFTNIGFNAAIIQQEKENIDDYLDTTWLLMSARGVLIAVVLVAASPLIADVFNEPRAEGLIRLMSLSPIFLGMQNPGVVYFQKDLEFHKQFVYKLSSEIVRFCVAVGYALMSPTATAFVMGYLAASGFRFVLSYVIHDYRPWPLFDREIAGELINYGKWVTGSSILYFLYSEGDDAFVGWLLGPTVLGFYQYAYRFSNAPATEVTQVISSVMFPAFSKYQTSPSQLRDAFVKTIRINAAIAFPISFGILLVAPSFVRGFFGSEWTAMIPLMQILAIYGLLRAFTKVFGSVWKAVGRPDLITKLSAVRVVILAILIYPVSQQFGAVGTAAVVTGVFVFPMIPLDLYYIVQSVDVRYVEILREVFYPLLASSLMAAGVWMISTVAEVHPLVEFSVLILAGMVLYSVALLLLELVFDVGFKQNFEMVLTSVRD